MPIERLKRLQRRREKEEWEHYQEGSRKRLLHEDYLDGSIDMGEYRRAHYEISGRLDLEDSLELMRRLPNNEEEYEMPWHMDRNALYGHYKAPQPNLGAIKVKKLHEDAVTPVKATEQAVGFDISAIGYEVIDGEYIKLYTGIAVTPPTGYSLDIVARSSLYKQDLTPATGFGVIDPDYTGELMFVCRYVPTTHFLDIFNIMHERIPLEKPFRFGQLIPRKMHNMGAVVVDELQKTVRGSGGFGSTGS